MQKIIITWWAGFIGSNFLNLFVLQYPDIVFINIDALTYAGKLDNIEATVSQADNYYFEKIDIRDIDALRAIYTKYKPTDCIHFAAESHVDNSIKTPWIFLETNVLGTNNLLLLHKEFAMQRFHYISTDEVYGELPMDKPEIKFTEDTPLCPSSPYSVSKASGDMLTQAFGRTYGIDVVISRCSNNYGPRQDTEKLIPHFIDRLMHDQKVPLYGDGANIRDWLHVSDHCDAIWTIFTKAMSGSIYNVWGNNEMTNKQITSILLDNFWYTVDMIDYVNDRLWHDKRYAIDSSKLQRELNWMPQTSFDQGIKDTIQRYKITLAI
jgi:dTDP-glucose 4,6-dehydratase